MAPVFASPDIAALVAAFPPPTPTKHQPSLIRGLSGNDLFSSRIVLSRFHKLVENGSGRINVKDLPSLLGIHNTHWLFDCYEGNLHFSFEKHAILTGFDFNELLAQLRSKATDGFVSLLSFAQDNDVANGSILAAVDRNGSFWRIFNVDASRSEFISSIDHVERTRQSIVELINHAGSEKIQLSQQLPAVPYAILKVLISDVLSNAHDVAGTFEDSAGEVVFVPSSYLAATEEKQRQAHALTVQQFVEALKEEGWCMLSLGPTSGLAELQTDVRSAFSKDISPAEEHLDICVLENSRVALIRDSVLRKEMEGLKTMSRTLMAPAIASGDHTIGPGIEAELIKQSWKPQLAAVILQTQAHREVLERSLTESITEIQREKFLEFEHSFQSTLTASLQLYAAGIFEEPTLKQHQEDYLLEYFRSEVIPQFVKDTQPQNLDTYPKIRPKDVEKMSYQCSSAQTFADLRSNVLKFGKKYNISEPSPSMLASIKRETVQQKAKAMQKMTRGSDVLQNLIWILLAQKSEGLFMTAGKDTSRMIKQYQVVGDPETGRQLERWRDSFKSGQGGEEVVREMRELAGKVVEEMFGSEK